MKITGIQTGKIRKAWEECRACRVCRDFKWLIALLLWTVIPCTQAQEIPFQKAEELNYTIRYKYGLVVMKAASARYSVSPSTYNRKPAVKSFLGFRTSSFFDKIVNVRDTMNSYASMPDLTPLYHNRIVHEGNYHYVEEMWIRKQGDAYTELKVKRVKEKEVRIDTTISVHNLGYDLLNIFLYVRTLNYSGMQPGDTRSIATFWGNKKINLTIRYQGKELITTSDSQKRWSFHLTMDIIDEAFTESKNAMEAWMGEDTGHIPLKIKAKLKIGAAEAELVSYKRMEN
jgi:hypothetical protein